MINWDLGSVVFSEYDPDKFIGVTFDHYGELDAGAHPAELHASAGFYSRPRDPTVDKSGNVTPGGGCNMWLAVEGNTLHGVLGSDPRAIPKLPQLKKGGAVFYGDTGQGQIPYASYDGDSGSFTQYIPYAFVNGAPTKAMAISLSVDNAGQESISIIHGSGMAITMAAGGKNSVVFKNKAGNSYIELNDDGITLNGNVTVTGFMVTGVAVPGAAALAKPVLQAGFTPSASFKAV